MIALKVVLTNDILTQWTYIYQVCFVFIWQMGFKVNLLQKQTLTFGCLAQKYIFINF